MPSEPRRASASPADTEQTAIFDTVPGGSAPRGYGDRFEEDAFDHPSPQATDAGSADAASGTATGETVTAPHAPAAGRRRAGSPASDGRRQAISRHRSVLMACAALVVLGGFGFALSSVSEAVSSNPTPGGTAQVSAPRSPTAQPLPPDVTTGPASPGGGAGNAAVPAQTGSPPGTAGVPGPGEDHGREEQGREDGDDAED